MIFLVLDFRVRAASGTHGSQGLTGHGQGVPHMRTIIFNRVCHVATYPFVYHMFGVS